MSIPSLRIRIRNNLCLIFSSVAGGRMAMEMRINPTLPPPAIELAQSKMEFEALLCG
jgi:hypothetical protein